jgi:hypothetical protein
MNELLRVALDGSSNPLDQFVFLSGEHLPVKPFLHAHNVLTQDATSSFCVLPTQRWECSCDQGCLVKHSQWIVLNRQHALTAVGVANQSGVVARTLLARRSDAAGCPAQEMLTCLDEFWHFHAIFGILSRPAQSGQATPQLLSSVRGGVNSQSLDMEQGACTTFVHWPRHKLNKFYSGNSSTRIFSERLETLGVKWSSGADDVKTRHSGGMHFFEGVNNAIVNDLFASPYLFARKFRTLDKSASSLFEKRLR